MNRSILMFAMVAALGLSACERQPTVVTVPAPAAEPGPGTTVIVEPAPPPQTN